MTNKLAISIALASSLISAVASAAAMPSREGDMQISIRAAALTKNVEATNTYYKKTGWGGEIEAKYFISNNFASVVGAAWHHRVPLDVQTGAHFTKADYFPIKVGIQLHAMNPSEKLSIYAGGGYTYVISNFTWDSAVVVSKEKKNQHGAYVQAGVDLRLDDNMAFNVDVQKIFSLRDIKYTVLPTVATTTSHEPLIISAGVTFNLAN